MLAQKESKLLCTDIRFGFFVLLRLPRAGLVRLAFHEEDQDQGHGGLLSKLGVLPSTTRNPHQLFNEDRDSEIINKNLSCLLRSMSKRLGLNNLVISKQYLW